MTSQEKQWGMAAHMCSLIGFIIPFGNLLAPLIIWQWKKHDSEFVASCGKESLNLQISMFIYALAGLVLSVVGIGVLLILILAVLNLVMPIIAGVKANDGVEYRYPLILRIIK